MPSVFPAYYVWLDELTGITNTEQISNEGASNEEIKMQITLQLLQRYPYIGKSYLSLCASSHPLMFKF